MESTSADEVNGLGNGENLENDHDVLQENQANEQTGIPLAGEAEEEAEELVVLHPDHPLMQRFQEALTKMLQAHISEAAIELREKSEELKREKAEHLELGSTLYNAQQELSRFQGQLEQKHEEGMVMQAKREEMDMQLMHLRKTYKESQQEYDREYKKMMTLREEVDNLCLRLYYLNNARDEVKKDIIIMKRAAEKAVTDLTKVPIAVV
ncbi:Coiled-coil domain-containing protein 40 [Sparganum proliferum]